MADDNRTYVAIDPLMLDRLERTMDRLNTSVQKQSRSIEQAANAAAGTVESVGRLGGAVGDAAPNIVRGIYGAGVVTSTGLVAGNTLWQNRRNLMGLARRTARGQLLGAVLGANAPAAARGAGLLARGGMALGSLLAPVLGPIAAIAAGVAAGVVLIRGMSATMKRMLVISQRQTAILSAQLRASLEGRESLNQAEARRQAGIDPLLRTVPFHRQRMRELGAEVTPLQQNLMARLAVGQQELQMVRMARERTVTAFIAPYQLVANEVQMLLGRVQTAIGKFVTEPSMGNSLARAMMMPFPSIRGGVLIDTLVRAGATAFGGDVIGEAQRRAAFGQSLSDELLRLQYRGPAAVMEAAPSIRAGSRAEYEFRVRTEREELYRQAERAWQDRILELMESLVELGRLDPEIQARTEIQFGREVTVGVE